MSGLLPWQSDKARTDKFLPELKRICGEFLIGEAPQEDDAQHNTDLIVLKLDAVRIACRVRTHKYIEKYGDEFTIRSERPHGVKTELTKIIEGWGDYILYGIANAEDAGLDVWVLGDLRVFRLWFNRQLVARHGKAPGIEQANGDGSSNFRAFQIDEMPMGFIVARKAQR